MKKSYLILAAAALTLGLASCSSDESLVEVQKAQETTVGDGAISFEAYTGRTTTRAGYNGVLDNTATGIQNAAAGFGVFGYYTNGESYTGSSRPDFFYNQKVYYKAAATEPATSDAQWYYSPVKYWPNEFGSDAISDQVDKVTLFAYAPYVAVTPLTGLVVDNSTEDYYETTNITGMTRNNATGDPLIKYVSSMMSNNSVDLCYGVAANNFTSSSSSANPNNKNAGQPYVDMVKPGTDANSKINFDFKHALAQLNVTIDANVSDLTNAGLTTPLANGIDTDHTRIWVRSVTFEGVTLSGALNLNSPGSSPNWYDINGTSLISTGSITVYDGRKDGREANEIASSETPATLNPIIVQSAPYTYDSKITAPTDLGVTKAKINLFAKVDGKVFEEADNANAPVFVIPTKEKMKVVIVYDVETVDPNLATVLSDGSTKGSTIENRIYKTIDAFGNIEAGKHYTLNLHLGMRTVDFDATVTEWEDYQSDVDLPSNIMTFAAEAIASAATGTITIPASDATCTFAVSGLTPGAVPSTLTKTGTVTPAATPANGSGISTISLTAIGGNTNTTVLSDKTVTVGDGTNQIVVTIKQSPLPIGLTDLEFTAGKITCTYVDHADVAGINAFTTKKVFKNGIDITAQCTFGTDNKEITIGTGYELINTDIVKVVLGKGTAQTESYTKTVADL